MERISHGYSELVGSAMDHIPAFIRNQIHFHFFTGNPFNAGLIDRSEYYKESLLDYLALYVSPYAQSKHLPKILKVPTIVLLQKPDGLDREVIVHEVGHALDEYLDNQFTFNPVSEYAKTDDYENFAEAFLVWLSFSKYLLLKPEDIYFFDHLFESANGSPIWCNRIPGEVRNER
jgi:hypothetical protein